MYVNGSSSFVKVGWLDRKHRWRRLQNRIPELKLEGLGGGRKEDGYNRNKHLLDTHKFQLKHSTYNSLKSIVYRTLRWGCRWVKILHLISQETEFSCAYIILFYVMMVFGESIWVWIMKVSEDQEQCSPFCVPFGGEELKTEKVYCKVLIRPWWTMAFGDAFK